MGKTKEVHSFMMITDVTHYVITNNMQQCNYIPSAQRKRESLQMQLTISY